MNILYQTSKLAQFFSPLNFLNKKYINYLAMYSLICYFLCYTTLMCPKLSYAILA